ncbi:MAG: hypothetical protein WA705_30005 [Candidatus Ozemobacteraceae bacterium]
MKWEVFGIATFLGAPSLALALRESPAPEPLDSDARSFSLEAIFAGLWSSPGKLCRLGSGSDFFLIIEVF